MRGTAVLPRLLLALGLIAPGLDAAIDGTAINGTTNMPQAGVAISLIHPGENGMQTLGSTKSGPDGKFKIDQDLPSPPALLQAVFQGVTYNQIVPPGSPTQGIHLNVFDAVSKLPPTIKLAQHMMMIEPAGDAIHVTEVFQYENDGALTYQDPTKGSIQFFLPKGAEDGASVSIEAPGGMPIKRPPEKTSQAGVYKESYPVKPGDTTTYELTYTLPPAQKLSGKLFGDSPAMLVTGSAVTLSGDVLKSRGQDPKLKAHIYEVSSSPAGTPFEVGIEGSGPISAPETAAAGGGGQDQENDTGQPQPTAGPARVYDRMYWLLGLAFGILAVGGTLLYRKGAA
jgi:hypothetical protein